MQRPASVTVFGIMNFVFAAFGVIGLMASFSLFRRPADSNNPIIQFITASPDYAVWLTICIALGVLSCAALLTAGVGLLGLKPWARHLAIAYAIYAIVFCLGALLINLIFMDQPMLGPARQQRAFETVGTIGGPVSGTIGELFWLLHPIVLLVFMTRPKAVAAFRRPPPSQI